MTHNLPTVIDLNGPDGNAFALIAYARRWSKFLDLDPVPIQQDMMSGDCDVFEEYFGDFVTLYR